MQGGGKKQWSVSQFGTDRQNSCGEQSKKKYHYRPEVPRGYQEVRFPDYVTMAQDGGNVVSFTHR